MNTSVLTFKFAAYSALHVISTICVEDRGKRSDFMEDHTFETHAYRASHLDPSHALAIKNNEEVTMCLSCSASITRIPANLGRIA